MLFVDSGDFEFTDISNYYTGRDNCYLPGITVLLNQGVIIFGELTETNFKFNRYPEEINDNQDWYFCPYPGDGDSGSLEGNHLGFLYYSLLEHLANSHLEPPSLSKYMTKMMAGRKSLTKKANSAS